MNATLKITKIGNSAGVVLPKKFLQHLGAEIGDNLMVVRTSRGLELSKAKSPSESEDQMATAREVMDRRHRALMALADRIMDEDRIILSALAKS